MSRPRILIVDDDPDLLELLESGMAAAGFKVSAALSGEAAVAICREQAPDLMILDMYMDGMTGIETVRQLRRLHLEIPFLFLSASSERDIVKQAVAEGALGYLVKPIVIQQLLPSIEAALERAADIDKLRQAEAHLGTALASGRTSSVAVGLIMERFRLSEQEAFEILRRDARSQRRKVEDSARDIVDATESVNRLVSNSTKT